MIEILFVMGSILCFCIFIKFCNYFEFIPRNLQLEPPKEVKLLDVAGTVAKKYNKNKSA